jgi:hypothetical protein
MRFLPAIRPKCRAASHLHSHPAVETEVSAVVKIEISPPGACTPPFCENCRESPKHLTKIHLIATQKVVVLCFSCIDSLFRLALFGEEPGSDAGGMGG